MRKAYDALTSLTLTEYAAVGGITGFMGGQIYNVAKYAHEHTFWQTLWMRNDWSNIPDAFVYGSTGALAGAATCVGVGLAVKGIERIVQACKPKHTVESVCKEIKRVNNHSK